MVVKEYKLLTDINASGLTKEVNKLLAEGWILYGETYSTNHESWGHFKKLSAHTQHNQAMIKS